MVNCLVTGGCGFIGSHLCEALKAEGNTVTAFDNLSITTENISDLKKSGINILVADVIDYNALKEAMKGVDIVFHLAAINRAMKSIKDPLKGFNVNATGTMNVLEAARQSGVEKVINVSSSSVYGGMNSTPLNENMAPNPTHTYASAKLCAEICASTYYKLYGLKTVNLRYFSIYGPRQRGDIDEAAVISKFIHYMHNNRSLPVYGDGSQTRNFTFVKDCVNATMLASQKKQAVGETINIANNVSLSINELISHLENIFKRKAQIIYEPKRPGDPQSNPADVEKAKKKLDWTPKTSFGDGLRQTVDFYISKIGAC